MLSLVIYLDDNVWTVAVGIATSSGPRLESMVQLQSPVDHSLLESPDRIGRWLRTELNQHGMGAKECVLILPRRQTSVRVTELPNDNPRETQALAMMHLEGELGIDPDNVTFDCAALPPSQDGRPQTAIATMDKSLGDALKQVTQRAHLKLRRMTTTDEAIARYAQQRQPAAADKSYECLHTLALCEYGDRTEIISILDNRVCQTTTICHECDSQSVRLVSGGVARHLSGYTNPETPPTECVFITDRESTELVNSIRDRFSVTPVPLAVEAEITPPENVHAGESAACLGGLLLSNDRHADVFDFTRTKQRVGPSLRYAAVGIAIGFIAFVGGVMGWMAHQDALTALDREMASLQTVQQLLEKRLKDEQITLSQLKTLQSWREKDVTWLHVLGELEKEFPDENRVYFSSVVMNSETNGHPANVRVTAHAKSTEDVESLNQKLLNLAPRLLFIPQEVRPNAGDKEYSTRFKFGLQVPHQRRSD